MKLFKTIGVAGVLTFSALSPLFAASASVLHVRIPFAFVVSGQTLPAGEYLVDTASNNGVVMIQGVGRGVVVLSSPVTSPSKHSKPGLTFQRRVDGEYLVAVKTGDESTRQITQEIKAKGKMAALAAVAAK